MAELLIKTVRELPNGNILLEKHLYFLSERDIIELRKKTNWIKGAHGYFAGSYPEGSSGGFKNSGLTNSSNGGIINTGSGRMNDRKISNVYTGIRNEIPLTDDERKCVVKYLTALDVDMDKVIFTDVYRTAYSEKFDAYIIGTDVKPLENAKFGVINANQRISINGTVAHEVVGHREAHIKGKTQNNDVLEEVQASIRAARFAPGLTSIERITLLMDARARLGRSRRLKDVRNLLYIDER